MVILASYCLTICHAGQFLFCTNGMWMVRLFSLSRPSLL